MLRGFHRCLHQVPGGTSHWLVLLLLTSACSGEIQPPVDCGAVAVWDGDGDGISDLIEQNNLAEGYHHFDPVGCDTDPTVAFGSHGDGRLDPGLNLGDRGPGYRHFRGGDAPDSDDWAVLDLLGCLEAVGRDAAVHGIEMVVLDLSLRSGGRFPPHKSHHNGLDADLRYVAADGLGQPLDIARDPHKYDPVATQTIMAAFVAHCAVAAIFVDLDALAFSDTEIGAAVLFHASGHSNHFHVRLHRPTS